LLLLPEHVELTAQILPTPGDFTSLGVCCGNICNDKSDLLPELMGMLAQVTLETPGALTLTLNKAIDGAHDRADSCAYDLIGAGYARCRINCSLQPWQQPRSGIPQGLALSRGER
jgi:hypothetical protein